MSIQSNPQAIELARLKADNYDKLKATIHPSEDTFSPHWSVLPDFVRYLADELEQALADADMMGTERAHVRAHVTRSILDKALNDFMEGVD